MGGYNILDILIAAAYTAVFYMGPPLIYAFFIKKKLLSPKEAKITAVITGITVYLIFQFLYVYLKIEGGGTIYPAVFWSTIAYWIIKDNKGEGNSKGAPKDTTNLGNTNIEAEIKETSHETQSSTEPNQPRGELTTKSNEEKEAITAKEAGGNIPVDKLKELKALYDEGLLTEEEYSETKKRLLNI